VHRKCSRISSSQIVKEFEANPTDKKMVNVTLTQPQIEPGSFPHSVKCFQRGWSHNSIGVHKKKYLTHLKAKGLQVCFVNS